MNPSVNADIVINALAQQIAFLIVDAAVKDAHIAALTDELAQIKAESAPEDRAESDGPSR